MGTIDSMVKIKDKLISVEMAASIAKEYRDSGKKVVFTNGCFDILHVGHVTYLQEAKAQGDILIVGVNADLSVTKLKGDNRPINPLEDRMYVLAGLMSTNYIISFEEETPIQLIEAIHPDVLIKGLSYDRGTDGKAEAWGKYDVNIDNFQDIIDIKEV